MTIKAAAFSLRTGALLLLCALPAGADFRFSTNGPIRPEDRVPGVAADLTNSTPILAPRPKPATFNSYGERLDFIHENMEPTLRIAVTRTDDLFKDEAAPLDPPECRFRLSFESETRLGADRQSYKFEPNLDADIELPNLEHRWKVYLRSYSRDSITDRDEDNGGRTTRFGISQFRDDLNVEADAGVRLRVHPEAYTRLQWSHCWTPRYWVIRPSERLFYESDKGLGELSSVTVHRWLGRRPQVFVQSISQAEFSQSSEGVEFDQAFRLGKVREALEPMGHWTRGLGDRDVARGLIFRAGLYGHSEDESTVDGYRVGVLERRPLYKKWIYLSTNPELIWERARDFKTEVRLRLAVDMLFWGSMER